MSFNLRCFDSEALVFVKVNVIITERTGIKKKDSLANSQTIGSRGLWKAQIRGQGQGQPWVTIILMSLLGLILPQVLE